MTTNIYNFIKDLIEMIKVGFKNITIYKGQSRYYLSIGNKSIPLLSQEEMKIAVFIISLLIGGIIEKTTITAQEVEIIKEAVKWYAN